MELENDKVARRKWKRTITSRGPRSPTRETQELAPRGCHRDRLRVNPACQPAIKRLLSISRRIRLKEENAGAGAYRLTGQKRPSIKLVNDLDPCGTYVAAAQEMALKL